MASQRVNRSDSELETSQSECEESQIIVKKSRRSCEWLLVKTFESKEDALEFIKGQKEFRFNNRYNTNEGEVHKYVCRQDRNCFAKIRLLLESRTSKALVQRADGDHDHEVKRNPKGIQKY